MKKELKCSALGCESTSVTMIRATQFAGDHPFCQEHGEQEKNKEDNDPSEKWYSIEEYQEQVLEGRKKRKEKLLERQREVLQARETERRALRAFVQDAINLLRERAVDETDYAVEVAGLLQTYVLPRFRD